MIKNDRQNISITLKKADSLLTKIQRMVDEDKYCIDIIQQNLAVIGLLKSANISLLGKHLNGCVKDAIKAKDAKRVDEIMDELLKIIKTAQNK
ncbi:metal-sensing transcriptional repressor [Patescibacteria group bacterium]|nr:metal-sensing transcriptional repressor [Patescibacteria group bacterium]